MFHIEHVYQVPMLQTAVARPQHAKQVLLPFPPQGINPRSNLASHFRNSFRNWVGDATGLSCVVGMATGCLCSHLSRLLIHFRIHLWELPLTPAAFSQTALQPPTRASLHPFSSQFLRRARRGMLSYEM
jgi:hypothetical protein